MNSKGFTLVELLVVIAIIGLISAVILPNLTGTRDKAADVAIKQDIISARNAALMYFDSNSGVFGTNVADIDAAVGAACSTANTVFDPTATYSMNPVILAADKAARGSGSNPTTKAACGISAAGTAWIVYVPLVNASGGWCVDSTNASKAEADVPAAGVFACP